MAGRVAISLATLAVLATLAAASAGFAHPTVVDLGKDFSEKVSRALCCQRTVDWNQIVRHVFLLQGPLQCISSLCDGHTLVVTVYSCCPWSAHRLTPFGASADCGAWQSQLHQVLCSL